jgi:stearoyl-CoA desaturase (delta-9 desaturase)
MPNESKFPFARFRRAFKVLVLFLHQWLWLGAFFVPFEGSLLPGTFAIAFLLMLGVEIGHHRYFSHRTFRTGRTFQFMLGVLATAAFQRDVIWWASMHRQHHCYSDQEGDPHSPYPRTGGGYLHAHINWAVHPNYADPFYFRVRDLTAIPEIRWLGQWHYLINLSYAFIVWFIGEYATTSYTGFQLLIWWYVMPIYLTQQILSALTTYAHGRPRLPGSYRSYEDVKDKSVNHWLLGIISTGGGFHNNHHRFPTSARMGLRWFEIDISYLIIRMLERIGIVYNVRIPSELAKTLETNQHE